MSGKVKQRTSANAADSATQSVNEKILRECHSLYTDPDNGEFLLKKNNLLIIEIATELYISKSV